MHPKTHCLIGVHISDRLEQASAVQAVFTKYGNLIQTRLGLHQVNPDGSASAPNGLVVLEMVGKAAQWKAMLKALNAIRGVEAKQMTFGH